MTLVLLVLQTPVRTCEANAVAGSYHTAEEGIAVK